MKINKMKSRIDGLYSGNPILYDCEISPNFQDFLNTEGINLDKYEVNHVSYLTLAIKYELNKNLDCSKLDYQNVGQAQLIANGVRLLYSINNYIDDLAILITIENNRLKVNLIKSIYKG